jgi:hypothetical protein
MQRTPKVGSRSKDGERQAFELITGSFQAPPEQSGGRRSNSSTTLTLPAIS